MLAFLLLLGHIFKDGFPSPSASVWAFVQELSVGTSATDHRFLPRGHPVCGISQACDERAGQAWWWGARSVLGLFPRSQLVPRAAVHHLCPGRGIFPAHQTVRCPNTGPRASSSILMPQG